MSPGALLDARTVLLIHMPLLTLLAILFAAISRQASGALQARLWALGYGLIAVGLLLSNLREALAPMISAAGGFAAGLAGSAFVSWGLFLETRQRFPWRTMLVIGLADQAAQIYFLTVHPDIRPRIGLASAWFCLNCLMGIYALLSEQRSYRRWPTLFTLGWLVILVLIHGERVIAASLASLDEFSGPPTAAGFAFGFQLALSLIASTGLAVGLFWTRMAEWHLTIITEMDERRRSEAALAVAKEAAEKAGQAKSRFLASISHDIRTPMNAIVGLSRLLAHTPLNDRQTSHVSRIGTAANTLLQLIEGVLDASRLEAGTMSIEIGDFNLADVLARVDAIAGVQAEAKDIVLSVVPAADVPMALRGDPVRLGQILLNIVGNAVKFTESGEVTLSVAVMARRAPSANRPAAVVLRFIVHDTGPGIVAQDLPHIFEPFRQGSDQHRRAAGSGLGLAIVAQLVRLMDGSIRVDSVHGLGSTFIVDAPFAYADAPLIPAAPVEMGRVDGARILVVDDDDTNREVASEILAEAGAIVELAADGETAVARALAAGETIDAILMDMSLPGIDGVAATERIRAVHPATTLPIIAVTAHAIDEERARCLAAGMNDFVTKPVEPARLLAVLARCLPERAALVAAAAMAAEALQDGALSLPPIIAGFDIPGTVRRFCGNTSVVERLLGRFSQRCHETGSALQTALGSGQLDEARALAHGFKGAAATLGAKGLSDLAAHLETALKAKDRAAIGTAMTALTEEMGVTAKTLAECGFQ